MFVMSRCPRCEAQGNPWISQMAQRTKSMYASVVSVSSVHLWTVLLRIRIAAVEPTDRRERRRTSAELDQQPLGDLVDVALDFLRVRRIALASRRIKLQHIAAEVSDFSSPFNHV